MSSVFMCTIGCSHRDAGARWHLQDPCPHPPPPERESAGNRTRCWTGRPPCRVIGATRPATPLLTAGPDIDTPPSSEEDRKSTRLNSSHVSISYAVFCLKKKNKTSTVQCTST